MTSVSHFPRGVLKIRPFSRAKILVFMYLKRPEGLKLNQVICTVTCDGERGLLFSKQGTA